MLRLLRLLLLLLLPPPGSPEPSEPPGLASLSPGAPPQAPDLLFADGLRAYSAGAWAPAVALLREALRSREALGRARRDCGASCAAEPDAELPGQFLGVPQSASGPRAWEPLLLRATLRRAECLTQCAARRLGPGGTARFRMGSVLRDAFRRREPYNYLQRAYYQVREPPRVLPQAKGMSYLELTTRGQDAQRPTAWGAYNGLLHLSGYLQSGGKDL